MRVSKWWQNCNFWVNCPFKSTPPGLELESHAVFDQLLVFQSWLTDIQISSLNHCHSEDKAMSMQLYPQNTRCVNVECQSCAYVHMYSLLVFCVFERVVRLFVLVCPSLCLHVWPHTLPVLPLDSKTNKQTHKHVSTSTNTHTLSLTHANTNSFFLFRH